MKIKKVYIGGWFQRTTLHLTEVWDFLKFGKTEIDLDEKVIRNARNLLEITNLSRENEGLEFMVIQTKDLSIRFYEDGLILIQRQFGQFKKDLAAIKDYYDNKLSKTLSFIFSKGAPVPKELANIKTILPYILTVERGSESQIKELFKELNEEIYSVLSSNEVTVYRSPGLIVINNLKNEELARKIIESQIFFREFKTQLHRYLNIHRIIWEKIDRIKDKGSVSGWDIEKNQNILNDYHKTITLIKSRINQMDTYLETRKNFSDFNQTASYLNPLFQQKFETLEDTHEYIKSLWQMTEDYLDSAVKTFEELQAQSTKNSISSLQLVTTIGVVAAILGYLGRDKLPGLTWAGFGFFVILVALTWFLNSLISKIYKNKRYEIKSSQIIKDIK